MRPGTPLAAASVGPTIPTHYVSQQTLLALCALAVAGLFMQSVTQASIQAEIGFMVLGVGILLTLIFVSLAFLIALHAEDRIRRF